jgi:hypothetical protein
VERKSKMQAYDYTIERPKLFTEDGFIRIDVVRIAIHAMLQASGAFTVDKLMDNVMEYDNFEVLAALDYLRERKIVTLVFAAPRTANTVYVGRSGVQ